MESFGTTFDISKKTIKRVLKRISPFIRRTPILTSPYLRARIPDHALLKLENLQVTGSFKARGAFHHLLRASDEERRRGVVVASGGNHGLAIAYAAARLSTPATVCLPESATPDRVARIKAWGARIVQEGKSPSEALAVAKQYSEREGTIFVHPFDSERTLQGTATLGLEILEDVPDCDALVVAVGGGGLLGGMAACVKEQKKDLRVIAIEPTGAAALFEALNAGSVVPLEKIETIADTLAPRSVAPVTLAYAQRYVDEMVLVSDQQLVDAMRLIWLEANQLLEPAGAASVAAVLSGLCELERFKRPVILICGGNAGAGSVFEAYEARAYRATALRPGRHLFTPKR